MSTCPALTGRAATIGEAPRVEAAKEISRALADREMFWIGTRGQDAAALAGLEQLRGCFTLTAPLNQLGPQGSRPFASVSLESIEGRRRERDSYGFGRDGGLGDAELKRRLEDEIDRAGDVVLLTYGSSKLAERVKQGRARRVEVAGLPVPVGTRLADKPTVEALLAPLRLKTLGWRQVDEGSLAELESMLADGPIVLRALDSSGGLGVMPCRSRREIEGAWPRGRRSCSAAPLLEDSIPLNASAALFAGGEIRFHPASVQLVGIGSCTDRPFGHCGNDFALAAALEPEILSRLEQMVREVGGVLASTGYRGAFGLDALLHRDELHFVEVNPRLQSSSSLGAEIAADAGEPGPFLDHLAALVGLPPAGAGLSLPEWVERSARRAQLVVYNGAGEPLAPSSGDLPSAPEGAGIFELPAPEVVLEPGASLARITLPRSITSTGSELEPEIDAYAARIRGLLRAADAGG